MKTAKSAPSPARGPSHYLPDLFRPELYDGRAGNVVPGDDRNTLVIAVRGGVQLEYRRSVADWAVMLEVIATDLMDRRVKLVHAFPDDGAIKFWSDAKQFEFERRQRQTDESMGEVQRIVKEAVAGNPEPAA